VKFAYSMGFSAIADRMVWLPSLSRDRKWPCPPIWRKPTLWMRVTLVAHKLEQSVMGQKMCFSDSYVIFGVWTENFNKFHHFSSKKCKIPYSYNDRIKYKSPNVPLQDELLTWTSQLRIDQPSITAIKVWHIAYCITCATKLINTAAHLVRAHLYFCTLWAQTQWFLLL